MRGKWLNVAGIATWMVCALPELVAVAIGEFQGWPAAAFVGAFLLFGVALSLLYREEWCQSIDGRLPVVLVAVESITGLTMVCLAILSRGGSGATVATLVIVAATLPYVVSPGWTWAWIGAQTLLLVLVPLRSFGGMDWMVAISFGMAIGGFQLFAATSSFFARSEGAAREQLAAANVELLATRALLAENSRVEERLRISRDLHDTLGHHLTALSLQLDVAARLTDGKTAEHVRQAHAITRLLLGDVRDVVSRLRDSRRMDLGQAIRALAVEQAGVAIHLDLPPVFDVEDNERAEALLRCVQEIITNTARHAQARNLWIRLDSRPDGIALHARDDGRGADVVACGHGLTGMRERFERHAGHIEFEPGRGTGFEIRGFLPLPAVS